MRLLGFVGGFVMWFDFDVDCGVLIASLMYCVLCCAV